jgi:hypothetical protein
MLKLGNSHRSNISMEGWELMFYITLAHPNPSRGGIPESMKGNK